MKGVTCCDEPINKYHPTRQFSALRSILLSPCSSIWINGPLFYCLGLISQPRPAAAASAHYSSPTGWLAFSENYHNTWRYRHGSPECSRHTLKTSRSPPLLFICQVAVNRIHAETTSQAGESWWSFWTLICGKNQSRPTITSRTHWEFKVSCLSMIWRNFPHHYRQESESHLSGLRERKKKNCTGFLFYIKALILKYCCWFIKPWFWAKIYFLSAAAS